MSVLDAPSPCAGTELLTGSICLLEQSSQSSIGVYWSCTVCVCLCVRACMRVTCVVYVHSCNVMLSALLYCSCMGHRDLLRGLGLEKDDLLSQMDQTKWVSNRPMMNGRYVVLSTSRVGDVCCPRPSRSGLLLGSVYICCNYARTPLLVLFTWPV